MPIPPENPYVSRAGGKLAHALDTFAFDVRGLVCADFGCNVGGFTDCLLRRGAARVYAIDTGYGTLAWTLRQDDRVVVMERTNALHADPPEEPVDLVVIDLAWTPQRYAIPAALRWLAPDGRIISLLKPHYELDASEKSRWLVDGALEPENAERVRERMLADLPALGVEPLGCTKSPMTGGKSGRRAKGKGKGKGKGNGTGKAPGNGMGNATGKATGNVEYLILGKRVTRSALPDEA